MRWHNPTVKMLLVLAAGLVLWMLPAPAAAAWSPPACGTTQTAGGFCVENGHTYIIHWKYYTVRSGDTLWHIALRFTGSGHNWKMISDDWGRLPNPRLLHVGEWLIVPHLIYYY